MIYLWAIIVIVASLLYVAFIKQNKNESARHWSSVPGFCMGVGIAATFASLYLTFQGYKETQPLSDLIKEISSAFIGSLIGLVISLLMTYYIKSRISEIEAKEQQEAGHDNNPYFLLQRIVENTSATKSSINDLKSEFVRLLEANNVEVKASKVLLKDFTEKTEQFNTNLFNELIEKIENVVKETGGSAIEQSLQNLENINTQLSKKLEAIFGTTSETIAQGQTDLKDSIDNLKAALESKINEINKQTEESAKSAKMGIENTTKEVKEKVATMETTVTSFGNNISTEIEKVLAAKIQSLEKTFVRIEEYQTRSQTILETATNSFKETVEKYEQVNENKTELIDNIGQQLIELEAVRENGSNLIQHWEAIAISMENMQERINQINGVITQLDNIKTVLTTQQN